MSRVNFSTCQDGKLWADICITRSCQDTTLCPIEVKKIVCRNDFFISYLGCHASCRECSGSLNTSCTKCKNGYRFY